ncbi:MAG TPA: carboxypeptidase regulatory-like domain-containing protein [Pyrinomonadaceae bacterium]|jgi:YVTN family beta-propeller protein|nr:carboxypeptidase regulatory-like domain-containing protein [Pyrinomonadaceae bacterium]
MQFPHFSSCRRNIATALSLGALLLAGFAPAPPAAAQTTPFRNFEGPQVHPLAITPDGTRLLAANTPNGTLSVFQLTSGTPVLTAEIPVGLEPVSVAARNDREAWVVNWLSDSVSVVDLSAGNVVRTFDVGDEPTDVLFAGLNREMAFVCVSGGGSLLTTPLDNLGHGQVKVFDPSDPSAAPQTIEIFGKQPRALARDEAGGRVFVSVYESGNGTTVVPETTVRTNGGLPAPNPPLSGGLPLPPSAALVVRWNGTDWVDELNRSWGGANSQIPVAARVPYTLADLDLAVIDAAGSSLPTAVASSVRGLGTHVGNMAFDPVQSRLFVANLEDINQVRFEPVIKGRFQASRVSVLSAVAGAAPSVSSVSDLNPHVDLNNPAGSAAERAASLAMPGDIARQSDGTVYVAATSSARVGVLSPSGVVTARIAVGQGPTGLAVDDARQRLYVYNRFDQTLSVVDTNSKTQTTSVPVGFNPEPPAVRGGRRFLYDASLSSHGTVSCASCHLNGHRDGMAWDLGNPQGTSDFAQGFTLHPMKGPMTTQSLRGIIGTEPFHWRGDRPNLAAFNGAFVSLLGGERLLTPQEMASFTSFVQSLAYPPNPNQSLDRTLTAQAQRGFNAYNTQPLDAGALTCNICHRVQQFNNGVGTVVTGTGTDRNIIPGLALQEPQPFKVPQLRGLYQKVGMSRTPGEKLTGFGFIHDGTSDTIFNFLRTAVFTFPAGQTGDNLRRDVEAFLVQFDTGAAPAVGLQVTADAANKTSAAVVNRIALLEQQAGSGACDLVVRGLYSGSPRTFLRLTNGTYQPDSLSEATVSRQTLLDSVAAGSELTFTGVPFGWGRVFGIDRDNDGLLNDDEQRNSVGVTGRVVNASGEGVAGVLVTLSGSQSATALTDAAGRYVFNFVSTGGSYTVTPQQSGQSFAPASRSFQNPTWNVQASFISSTSANASDSTRFFVTQHYQDFFAREPDAPGLAHWTGVADNCGETDLLVCRVNVSGAFFLSIEFQQTGYLVYKTYKASFDDINPPTVPVPLTYAQLMADTQRIGRNVIVNQGAWQAQLETNKAAFFQGWVQRPQFLAAFPVGMAPAAFVDQLNARADGPLDAAERQALINELSANNTTAGRASVVRKVAEDATLDQMEKNRAFVLMQYFGYLRRNPNDAPEQNLDFGGYNHWLGNLERFGGNFVQAELVKAFITSTEYRQRFGQ